MLPARYLKLSLRQKIIIPFISAFLSIFTLGTVIFGYYSVNSLEQEIDREVEEISLLVLRDFQKEEGYLRLQAKLLAEKDTIRIAVEQRDRVALLQSLLPVKATLGVDLIKVIDVNGTTLVDLRQGKLNQAKLRDDVAIEQALSGMYLSDLIPVEAQPQSLLVGLTPLKSKDGVVGGVIIGTVVGNELLQKLNNGTRHHLVAFNQTQLIASTLPDVSSTSWQPPSQELPPTRVTIGSRTYIAKSVALSGANKTALTLVLLQPITPLEEAQKDLWLKLGSILLLGAATSVIVGTLVARAIANPLTVLTQATRKLAKGDLTARIAVNSTDEVGKLAEAFNLMAEQLAQRDRLLEIQLQQLKQALEEVQQTQSQLIQAEKMSSLGQMVAGVAHEINNPVNFIHANLDHTGRYVQDLLAVLNLYHQYYPKPESKIQEELEAIDFDFLVEDLPKMLSSMKMGTERIRQIVLSLRNFSRLDETEKKYADLHEGIDSTLLILNSRLKLGIKIIKHYGDLPRVQCYPAQLNQVFMNILSNAIDALLSQVEQLDKQIEIQTEMVTSEQIRVRIRDNGSGIPIDIQEKLFDPFFTTKEPGKGTGLGLSISYKIIEKHQGKIEVISQPGQGAEFAIALPIKQSKRI